MYLSSSSLMLRCFCCFNSTRRFSSAVNPSAKKKQLVFLGSPQVSASVLEALFNASSAPDSLFEVAAIVTQPPSGRSRGRKVTASPVAQHALDRGFPSDLIFTPERAGYSLSRKFVHRPYYKTRSLQTIKVKHIRFSPNKPHQAQGAISHYSPLLLPILTALQQRGKSNTLLGNAQCKPNQDKIKDHYYLCHGRDTCTPFSLEFGFEETFLSNLRALEPELCITAAYGNILPNKFLKIPPLGTVNLHPSVLPLYRGAAPVQRALQDGVKETGVSLAFTVRALDAGPVIACERMEVDDQIKAPDLLALLFSRGSKLLIHELPAIFDGSARLKAQPQEDSQATLAPKIGPEEAWLSFDQEAIVLHNKVRAFAGWPGTWARVVIVDNKSAQQKILDIKIITTRVSSCDNIQGNEGGNVTISNGALVFPCGSRTALEVLELQIPGKRVVNANAFWNGLQGQQLKLQ